MSPALGPPGRSWSARSLGSSGAAIPTTPTAITEHPARLHEPTKHETPTQLACPLRSRYVWSGETTAASRSPSVGSPAGKQRRGGGNGNGGLAGGGSVGEQQQPHQQPQRRYSSFEAFVVDGEVLDGETGWTSPSTNTNTTQQQHHHGHHQASSNGGGGGGGAHQHNNNNNNNLDSCCSSSAAGSALRPGGRANFFFGADYAAANKARADQAAARLPVGRVDPKAAAVLGVAGSSDSASPGGVASKAQRLLGVGGGSGGGDGRRGGGGGAGAGAGGEVLALQDESSPDLSSAGEGSVSPRKDEAPPGFDPLESVTGDGDCGGGGRMSSRQHDQRFDREDDSDVQVAFPPHFDDGRKSRSGSEDGGSNGKTRGSSGESLGTKSGSTSLLSMMSGSPRSLGTAPDSASGGSPRTPLSDHASTDGGGTATAAGSRRGSGSSRTQEVLPAVSVGEAADGGDEEDFDEMDVPSAHPTPLSSFGGDTGLPSDHPTPDLRAPSSRSRSQSRTSGAIGGDGKAPGGSSKSINSSSGSFMSRLKYWGGGANRQASEANEPTTVASSHTGKRAAASGVSPRKPPGFYGASAERRTGSRSRSRTMKEERKPSTANSSGGGGGGSRSSSKTRKEERKPSTANSSGGGGAGGGSSSSSRGRGAERRSEGSSSGGGRQVAAPVSESPPPYSESAASEAGGLSPSELRGCPVVPFDSVTSESMSVHSAVPPPAYRAGATRMEPSPPYSAAREQSARSRTGARSSSSSQHRHTAKEQTRLLSAAPPPVANPAPATAAAQTFKNFGASHRAELKALRRARGGAPAPEDSEDAKEEEEEEEEEVSDEESEMNWDANSDNEAEEKTELAAATTFSPVKINAAAVKAAPRPPPRYLATKPKMMARTESVEVPPQQMHQLRRTPRQQQQVSPPRYMAIVEAASATSALDTSSTSEQETSPSEDDGGMMAEILTDRLMEVCSKMEQVTAMPEDDLSDGGGGGGDAAGVGGGHKRRPSSRRRQLSNMSSSQRGLLHSSSNGQLRDAGEKDGDSDDGSVIDAGVAARKLRRERLRKRTKSRQLASVLTVPRNDKGEVIQLHTAAYNGESDGLSAYISQGGDLEVRDQYQATALMLCAERGHTEMASALLSAGADAGCVDENGNSALHLACFYGRMDAVELLLSVDADVAAVDAEGRTPLDLATDPAIRRLIRTEESVRLSGQTFDLLGAVEVNDTMALANFIGMGQEACGFPHNPNAVTVAAQRLRLDRPGRGGMTAVHLAAFHGYGDALRVLLEAGADSNAVCDDGETPLHTACTGGSTFCATLLLEHGANPLATDANGLVPCEKHIAGGRQEMKRLLEVKAFQATPANLLALRADLAEVALQIDAEEDLFVRKGVAIKYLRRALKKKDADIGRLRQTVDARDTDIRNLGDRMESVHRLLRGVSVQ